MHVLTHGRRFSSQQLTAAERRALGPLRRRHKPPRQWYANAQQVAIRLLHNVPAQLPTACFEDYVCWRTGIAISHAWLSLKGKLVDPTLR